MLDHDHSFAGRGPGTMHQVRTLSFGDPTARPHVHVQGGLHADEGPGMMVARLLADQLAQMGDRVRGHVTVVPMFLGTGKHAREDLPVLVQDLRAAHPGVHFHVQTAIGEDPRMTALMAEIACEAPQS